MDADLRALMVHTVTVTPLTGSGPYGPVYGTPQTVAGFLDDTRRLVRNSGGEEVVSQATLYTDLANADAFPPNSAVNLGYRTAEVIGLALRDAPGLGLPEHAEVTLT